MKKLILSVICLFAMSVSYLRAGGPSMSQYQDIQSYGVDVSTVVFSTIPVQAFRGPGLVYGARSSSITLSTYFDVFDTTNIPKSPAWTDPDFKFRINSATGALIAGGNYEVPLARPVRFKKGGWWQIGDATVNQGNLLFLEINP